MLYESAGLLGAATGLVVTGVIALGAGIWAGAPAGGAAETVSPSRWLGAALSVGIAGAFAVWLGEVETVRSNPVVRIAALLLLVGLPVYRLGLLLPALLIWSEREADEDDEPSSTLAPLIGGVLNGVVLGATLAGLILMPRISPGTLLFGTAVLLAIPMLFPEPKRTVSYEKLVYEGESPFGTIRVADTMYPGQRQPERVLYLSEEIESGELVRSGAPTFPYIAAAERWLAQVSAAGDAYLFLGGGAYTLPRRVAERDPSARIAVVERDPEVTRVARRFFGLRPEHGITPLHGDARAIAEGLPPGEWNQIFVDVYDGREEIPYSLVTREGFEVLRRLLRPDGTLLFNVIGVAAGEGAPRFWSTVRTLVESFPTIALYPHLGLETEGRQNFLIAAAPEPGRSFPAQAGLFDRLPEERWPGWGGTIVFRDRFPAADETAPPTRGAASGAFDPSAAGR